MLTACHLASSRWGGGPAVAASPHSGPTPRALFREFSFARAPSDSRLAARFFCQDCLLYIMKACQHLSLNASTPDDRCVGRHGTPTRAHILHTQSLSRNSLETAQWGYAQARAKFAAAPRGTDPAPQESPAALLKYTRGVRGTKTARTHKGMLPGVVPCATMHE